MNDGKPRIALFPGTFDPITNGHLDVIERGCRLFDELVVGVGENPQKAPMLPQLQRAAIIREVIDGLPGVRNVRVETFTGLTVEFARKLKAATMLRGIRNSSDLQFEFQVALTNRAVAGVETVFIMTSTEFAFTSSSLIRQIASMGGDVSSLVPPQVLPYIQARCEPAGTDHGLHE
jgi:pantetheine-phosphate adenylyltransferase